MKKLPLNLINLKYFHDAVKHGGISASAIVNHVSQSAISQGIVKLEGSLGFELIVHQPKRFKLTDEGQKLFERSKDVFQAIQMAEESFSTNVVKNIDFACTHSFAVALLPHHLKQAQKHLPTTQLKCRLGHAHNIMEWVKKGVIDFGILLDNIDLSAFECEQIYHGKYGLFVSRKCKDVENLSFLLDSEERTETNLLKKAYKKRYGRNLPVLMEISSWEFVAKLAEEGLGIGFFPDYVASTKQKVLKLYPHEIVSVPYKIYAIFAKDYKRGSHIEDFLKLLQEKQR